MSPRLTAALAASLLGASVQAQTRAGGEFSVAASTPATTGASVAVGPASEMMVVWSDTDGSFDGVFARRFDASGQPLGDPFRVNTATAYFQNGPTVAADPRGGYIVAWTEFAPSSRGALFQRYDAGGRPVGGEFQVASSRRGVTQYPNVAFDRAGNFVVAWAAPSIHYGFNIMVRLYDSSGAPQGSSGIPASGPVEMARFNSSVHRAPSGEFVVVWTEYTPTVGPDGALGHTDHVLGQRFDAAGARLGGEFHLSSAPFSAVASVGMADDGSFVGAWLSSITTIVARRFDPSGTPLGDEFNVNASTDEAVFAPTVAVDAEGNFAVTWSAEHFEGRIDSYLARFDRAGQRRGPELRVNTTQDWHEVERGRLPMAGDAAGNLAVVWQREARQPAPTQLFGQRFGGLVPTADRVDTGPGGNGVLEPGETVDLRPEWRNVNGAAQAVTGTLARLEGPAGATYTIADGSASYGTVANGVTAACTDCYTVGVSAPATRPATHWDALAVEKLAPDAQGQVKRWPLHVGGSFADVPATSAYYRFAETLLHRGVTAGCNADHFCPAFTLTRAQMAVFVLLSREGSGYLPPACAPDALFDDVPAASPYCRWVEELARRGVVGGCGPRTFCPDDAVSRDQMAVFLLRTLDPTLDPPACSPPNLFADVPETSGFCRWIEELARRGITGGCGNGNYCPATPVAREQMAAFLATTFGLSLYGL